MSYSMKMVRWIVGVACWLLTTSLVVAQPPVPRPSSLNKALNILLIGDSNVENGHVSGGLAKVFENAYGYYGSGYHSLVANVGNGSSDSYHPYFSITNTGSWTTYLMNTDNPGIALLAPDGTCVQSSTAGSHTDVSFYGNSIDIYYLANTTAGQFTVAIDGGTAQTVNTQVTTQQVKKVSMTGLSSGTNHSAVITVLSGTVTLFGMEAKVTATGTNVAVAHKWGRSYGETRYFVSLNADRWKESLQLLNPDWVYIMIGTNDNEINFVGWATYTANIATMVTRVRAALPNAHIMVASTLPHMESSNGMLYHSYWQKLPVLCSALGINYWNLNAYCGKTGPAVQAKGWVYPSDNIHFNALGGDSVAAELHRQLINAPDVTPVTISGTVTGSYPATLPSFRNAQIGCWVSADGKLEVDNQGRVISWYGVNNSIAVSQIVPSWRPTLVNNSINGKPTIHFNGPSSSQCMVFPGSTSIYAFSMVIKADSIGGALFNEGRCYYANFGPGPQGSNNLINTAVATNLGGTYYVDKIATPVASVQYPLNSYRLITYAPGGYLNVRVLGENQYIQLYTNTPDSVDGFWKGDIAELIMFVNGGFTDQTRQDVETYLWNKYFLSTKTIPQTTTAVRRLKNGGIMKAYTTSGRLIGSVNDNNVFIGKHITCGIILLTGENNSAIKIKQIE